MDKISTSELIAKTSRETGFSLKMVKEVVNELANQIDRHVANGTDVAFAGLGKFYPQDRRARVCHSPVTGAKIEVNAKRVLAFKASKASK